MIRPSARSLRAAALTSRCPALNAYPRLSAHAQPARLASAAKPQAAAAAAAAAAARRTFATTTATPPPDHLVRSVAVNHVQARLTATLRDGSEAQVPLVQLRDSCACSSCRHAATHQRLLETFDLPARPAVKTSSLARDGLAVVWDDAEQHQSLYGWAQLARLFPSPHMSTAAGSGSKSKSTSTSASASASTPDVSGAIPRYQLWDARIAAHPPQVPYAAIMGTDDGVREWTSQVRTHGFCLVPGTPATPQATQSLLERIAFVRTTHYGGFWDFTSDLRAKDTAYTSLALPAHTDTNYFRDPAGLQMFHLLEHSGGAGGESLFVDGYSAAAALQDRAPELADVLRRVPVLYECKGNDDVMLHAVAPVLPRWVPRDGDGAGVHDDMPPVRWNGPDRTAVGAPGAGVQEVEAWYEAARAFDGILRDKSLEFWVKLVPGTPIVFDNYRVLHGRAAFTGMRRMCGGYINAQDFLSRWKTLNYERQTLLDDPPALSDVNSPL